MSIGLASLIALTNIIRLSNVPESRVSELSDRKGAAARCPTVQASGSVQRVCRIPLT